MQEDLVSIVEASYDLSGDASAWLNGIVTRSARGLDAGHGVGGLLVDTVGGSSTVVATATSGLSPRALGVMGELLPIGSAESVRTRFQLCGPVGLLRTTLGPAYRGRIRSICEAAGILDTLYILAGDARGVSCILFSVGEHREAREFERRGPGAGLECGRGLGCERVLPEVRRAHDRQGRHIHVRHRRDAAQ